MRKETFPGAMMNKALLSVSVIVAILFIIGCQSDGDKKDHKKPEVPSVKVPSFNADSAYAYIETQVAFGPRVPNTEAHDQCAQYLSDKLKSYDFEVIEQKGEVMAYDKTKLKLINVIGRYKPLDKKRILLFAHWDTRHIADKDVNDKDLPIEGANDGGSGVGVLLEIARQIQASGPQAGIDIVFFDVEDYGPPSNQQTYGGEEYWCLGSQYWGKNMPMDNFYSIFGIGLDMVGAKRSTFPRDGYSISTASWVVKKIWDSGNQLGYSDYFIYNQIGGLTDDYLFVNKLTGIPCVDIINYDLNNGGFGDFHHTHKDNMSIIDKATLKAVGQTVMHVIYNE